MATNALIDNVDLGADPVSGAPQLIVNAKIVGSSVPSGREIATVIVGNVLASDTTAQRKTKVLNALDAEMARRGWPAPTNVVNGSSLETLR